MSRSRSRKIADLVGGSSTAIEQDFSTTGNLYVESSNPRIRLKETDTTDLDGQLQTSDGVFKIARVDDNNATADARLKVDLSTGATHVGKEGNPRGGVTTHHMFTHPAGTDYFEIQNESTTGRSDILFSDGSTGNYGIVGYNHNDDTLRAYAGGSHVLTITNSAIRNEPNAGQSTMWKVETGDTSSWGSDTFCLVRNDSGYARLFYEIWIWGIHGSYGYAYVSGNVSRYGNEFYVYNNDMAGANVVFESGLSGNVSLNGISLQRTVVSSSYSYQAVVKTYSPQNISVSVPTGGVLRHKGF